MSSYEYFLWLGFHGTLFNPSTLEAEAEAGLVYKASSRTARIKKKK